MSSTLSCATHVVRKFNHGCKMNPREGESHTPVLNTARRDLAPAASASGGIAAKLQEARRRRRKGGRYFEGISTFSPCFHFHTPKRRGARIEGEALCAPSSLTHLIRIPLPRILHSLGNASGEIKPAAGSLLYLGRES